MRRKPHGAFFHITFQMVSGDIYTIDDQRYTRPQSTIDPLTHYSNHQAWFQYKGFSNFL